MQEDNNLEVLLKQMQKFYKPKKDKKTWFVGSAFMFGVLYWVLGLDIFTILILVDIKYQDIFLLATVAIASSGIFYFTQNQLKWQIQPKDSVKVIVINVTTIATIAIYLLTMQNLKFKSIFMAQIFENIIASVFLVYYAKDSHKFVFIYSELKDILSYSYPLFLLSIFVFVALYIDRIMIKEFLDLNELGIYGIAYRFASVVGIFMIGF
jgi:O-antigen/teichoic acid export membrane protein